MIPSHEIRGLFFMNYLRLLMTRTTLSHELKVLDAINRLGLWWTRTTLSHDLRLLDAMNNSRVMVDMNDSRS